ncbi:MAG: hypothetical protein ABIU54_01735 [Candidatus Eisenbacteria bacterium]
MRRVAPSAHLALLLALWAPTASATVRYISPSGNAANSGTSTSPWSLAKANTSLFAGDICYVLPGIYSGDLDPANHGTPTNRIVIMGNLNDPAAALLTGALTTDRSYLTIKGLEFTSGIELRGTSVVNMAQYDSVYKCYAQSVSFVGSKHNLVASCQITNAPTNAGITVAFVFSGWQDWPGAGFNSNSEYDTLRANVIDMGRISYKGFLMRVFAQRCVIDSNQITGQFSGTNIDVQGRYLYNSYYNSFRDNRWVFEADNQVAGVDWNCFSLRDSSSYNLFERDTVLAGLQSGFTMQGRLMNAGTDAWNGSTVRNTYRQCFYFMNGLTLVQINGPGTVLDRSVFASTGSPALMFVDKLSYLTIDHCTFYSGTGRALEFVSSVLAGTPADSVRLTSNVFYSVAAQATAGTIKFPGASGFISSSNLFYTPTFTSVLGDRAANWSGATGTVATWCAASGRDCNSRFGNPLFRSASPLTFDPRLTLGSSAIGAGQGGSDAGAYPFVAAGADLTAPATVTDLRSGAISFDNAVLLWTAPGDDGMTGTIEQYDLRRSDSPITAANFASATAMSVAPTPVAGGGTQTYVALGLVGSHTYYFAVRARDEAGNWSGVSNALSLTTTAADITPPASIPDLSATP